MANGHPMATTEFPETKCTLLSIPIEVRLRIYDFLFTSSTITVLAEFPEYQNEADDDDNDDNENNNSNNNDNGNNSDNAPSWSMRKPPNLSVQLLRTCRQIHAEGQLLLYTSNTFDCSQREAMNLLLKTIGRASFSQITHIALDWDQLLDLSWALAQPDYVTLTSSLTTIDLSTWRTRILGGQSSLWRDVKAYERQLCMSAQDILSKHARLKLVGQRPYHRSKRTMSVTTSTGGGPGSSTAATATTPVSATTYRIKWRFLASEALLLPLETIVDLEAEIVMLNDGDVDPNQERAAVQGMLDAM